MYGGEHVIRDMAVIEGKRPGNIHERVAQMIVAIHQPRHDKLIRTVNDGGQAFLRMLFVILFFSSQKQNPVILYRDGKAGGDRLRIGSAKEKFAVFKQSDSHGTPPYASAIR